MKPSRAWLLYFLFLVLSFPALQGYLSFFESGQLNGAIISNANPVFTWANWWSGTYQAQKSSFLNDSTGCRPDFVRLNNQIDFSLFNKTHANSVLVGRDQYLFESWYVTEYRGINDSIPSENLARDMEMVKKIQDTLSRLGKTFVWVYAASKAWSHPDKIPTIFDGYKQQHEPDYTRFKRLCAAYHINTIDFNGWFMAMKDTARGMLFSKQGTHWSVYGAVLAEDSLVKYIERQRNISIPEIKFEKLNYSDIARSTDNDIGQGLNLAIPLQKEKYAYFDFSFSDGRDEKPKTILVGDSFGWTWIYNGISRSVGDGFEYWFYFKERWTTEVFKGKTPQQQIGCCNWQQPLSDAKCVVMILSPPNFMRIDKDDFFIKVAYDHFFGQKK